MTVRPTIDARLPPAGIAGLQPEWSRLVEVKNPHDDSSVTWHLLDSWNSHQNDSDRSVTPQLTLLCVHGNPSWSFLWRKLLDAVPASIRVIAVDQLDMGFSQRTGLKRTLAMRIEDLCQLTQTLKLLGPVVTVAHDWGGPISLGWALRHLPKSQGASDEQAMQATDNSSPTAQPGEHAFLRGVVLTNTAVHQPASAKAPSVIRLIRSRWLLRAVTVNTAAFIRGACAMSKPKLHQSVCDGFLAPYRRARHRTAIADFVADIPLDDSHESASTLLAIAKDLEQLNQIPALLLWGPRDRVFSDLYLHDLQQRLPHANVHRYPNAAHFVTEDADIAGAVTDWVAELDAVRDESVTEQPAGLASDSNRQMAQVSHQHSVHRRALADFSQVDGSTVAVTELAPQQREISFEQLQARVEALASGMQGFGITPGARVAVLITPGIELVSVVYACWRLGAVLVLVDSGLGRQGMQNALQGARPDFLIGIDKALVAARLLGWPGRRIAVRPLSSFMAKALHVVSDIESLEQQGQTSAQVNTQVGTQTVGWPDADALAAIVFTSGSTGPSKGVVYKHHQIQAQRDQLVDLYRITASDSLVAAFAPFALYGPTMGISSLVPDMDVTKPSTLTANALGKAVEAIGATLVFASPAALVNTVATQGTMSSHARLACQKVRLALSAGAPVRASLLEKAGEIFPNASMHTPYGMTEILPLADIDLEQLRRISEQASSKNTSPLNADAGVCVGLPVSGAQLSIDPLDKQGCPTGSYTRQAGVLGEIVVSAEHQRAGYDRLWYTQYQASKPQAWHRTGDVGQLDSTGRLWVGGRLVHIITTANNVLAPVAYEQRLEDIEHVTMAAVVGIGPDNHQVVVAVLQISREHHVAGAASLELTDRVRGCMPADIDIAAVLVVKQLPVDRRHNSKVDRTAVSQWAARVLSGDRVSDL